MPLNALSLGLLLLLVACTPQKIHSPPKQEKSEENFLTKIPMDCEALLENSVVWGYNPQEKWKPQSLEQAQEIAQFFSSFYLVPASSSEAWTSWLHHQEPKEGPLFPTQICDLSLSSLFILESLRYPWPNQETGKNLALRFLVNQQSRMGPLPIRALSLEVFDLAVRKRYLSPQKGKSILALKKKLQAYLAKEMSLQEDLEKSEEIRHELAKLLPLP